MNQHKVLLLLTILLLALVACGGADEESSAPLPTATLPQPTATLPPPVVSETGGATQPEEPAVSGPISPWPADAFGYGIQVHGVAVVGNPQETMDAVRNQLGLDWVKMQLKWPTVHPEPGSDQWFIYDGVINDAYSHGLNLMVSVVGSPPWTRAAGNEIGPPDDYTQYYNFLTELLQRHPGQIQAIEVWNEQNLDREWTTAEGLSPTAYVNFLQGAYETIKAIDPNIIVISGALAPTGMHDANRVTVMSDLIYLDEALAAGMLNYADCVGVHHNGYNIGPDVAYDQTGSDPKYATAVFRGPFDNIHPSWSFKTTLDLYAQKAQAIDPNMKLCVTEFGWASSEGYDAVPLGFEFFLDNTEQEQADYIVQAFRQMRDSGDVWLAFLFNFDFGNKGGSPGEDDTVSYSIVRYPTGVPRLAFGAIADMEKPR